MSMVRPGLLAVRAVNQYRTREVMSYLGLRYYLDNTAARSDDWVRRVATDLVLTRTNLPYFRAYHFKDISETGRVTHRPIFLPGPNEALAEAALLAECSEHGEIFGLPRGVFSYRLSGKYNTSGMYEHYMEGLKRRQAAIAEACRENPSGVVRYMDIRRFYPTITAERAEDVWMKYSRRSGLSKRNIAVGKRLIQDHSQIEQQVGSTIQNGRILTGPMFSHLIANLVLKELDERFVTHLPTRYVRYVDDITLIGDDKSVQESTQLIGETLDKLNLELHTDDSHKTITISSDEWLKGENDFQDGDSLTLQIKNYLFTRPGELSNLHQAFMQEGFRIPLKDYSATAAEASRVSWFKELAHKKWFKRKILELSLSDLVKTARQFRTIYEVEFHELTQQTVKSSGYERKRAIPRLRYLSSRLLYLATEESLQDMTRKVTEFPELHLHRQVMKAVTTGSIDSVLEMGTNAAQVSAQVMRAGEKRAICDLPELSEPQAQALAVFLVNGVTVDRPELERSSQEPELLRFARTGVDRELMQSRNPFMQEIACLHGVTAQPRHTQMLESAFDRDEELTMDAMATLLSSLPY